MEGVWNTDSGFWGVLCLGLNKFSGGNMVYVFSLWCVLECICVQLYKNKSFENNLV